MENYVIDFDEMTKNAVQNFGSYEKFIEWFNTPSENFGYKRPIDLIYETNGLEMIKKGM